MREAIAPFAPGPSLDDLERELKYVLDASRAEPVRRWLRAVCRADAQYAEADVWTVYYDTPDFQSLDEKLNSDYLKTKIRLRAYALPGGVPAGPLFLEAKMKIGARREKIRVRLPMPAEALVDIDLQAAALRDVPMALSERGVNVDASWEPMLALRYRRLRFVESVTGTRVSLDRDIAALRVNHRHLFSTRSGPLPVAVVEAKGVSEALPAPLRPLVGFGARKEAFSKYSALLLHVRRGSF